MFRDMNDEALQYFSACYPDITLTRQERWRQAKVIDSEDHFTGRTKERPESDFQFQFQRLIVMSLDAVGTWEVWQTTRSDVRR